MSNDLDLSQCRIADTCIDVSDLREKVECIAVLGRPNRPPSLPPHLSKPVLVTDPLVEVLADGGGGEEGGAAGWGDVEVLVHAAGVELDFEGLVLGGVADGGDDRGVDGGEVHGGG